MNCRKPNGVLTTVTMKLFFSGCPKNNPRCGSIVGAYLPAITVCRQQIFGV